MPNVNAINGAGRYSPSAGSNNVSRIDSKGFLKTIMDKLLYYIEVLGADNEINDSEYSFINSFGSRNKQENTTRWNEVKALTAEGDGGEVKYGGATATLFASIGQGEVFQVANWILSGEGRTTEMWNKAGSMMAGG